MTQRADITGVSKRLFNSQPTPKAPDQDGLSQDAVRDAVKEAFEPKGPKKVRKRTKKLVPVEFMSQQEPGSKVKPRRVHDKITIQNWHSIHELGKPMLPPKILKIVNADMQNLHDTVLYLEENLLKDSNPTFPLFMGKVPERCNFVDKDPGHMLFIRFDDIFDMLHMNALSPSLVRLMALSMEHQILRENNPHTSVIDPFYMLEGWLQSPDGRRRATE